MRKIVPIVILLASVGVAQADMNSEMDAWDTFVNTNRILMQLDGMRHEMRMRLDEERNRQLLIQSAPAPAYLPPKDECPRCAPSGLLLDTNELYGFKPHNKE